MHNAYLYHEANVLQKRDVISSLDQYAPKLKWKKSKHRIMDVGCGDGSVTSMLKKYVPTDFTLVGSDISVNMIKFASAQYCNEQTSFVVQDITGHLPDSLRDAFDHVFSFYALHWVLDQKRAFENIFNLLEEDGECLLVILGNNPVFDVYRVLAQSNKWSDWLHNVENYVSPYHDSKNPAKEVTNLMESVGFVDIEVHSKNSVFLYSDIEILKKHMTAINPFKIPADKNDEFMNEYVEILKDIENRHKINTNNFQNGIHLYYTLLIAYGRKPVTKITRNLE